ncbi:MAG: hypothetical protein EBT20_09560 [Alphaproteobacteria bacterium]|nr:hypothetical protein [Alphaproteobacteria bacterium]
MLSTGPRVSRTGVFCVYSKSNVLKLFWVGYGSHGSCINSKQYGLNQMGQKENLGQKVDEPT